MGERVTRPFCPLHDLVLKKKTPLAFCMSRSARRPILFNPHPLSLFPCHAPCSVTCLQAKKEALPRLRSEVQGDAYKPFYKFVFKYVKDATQKSLGVSSREGSLSVTATPTFATAHHVPPAPNPQLPPMPRLSRCCQVDGSFLVGLPISGPRNKFGIGCSQACLSVVPSA